MIEGGIYKLAVSSSNPALKYCHFKYQMYIFLLFCYYYHARSIILLYYITQEAFTNQRLPYATKPRSALFLVIILA